MAQPLPSSGLDVQPRQIPYRSVAKKCALGACVALLAFAVATVAISYLIVFKRAPENLFDTLCWVTLGHIGVSVMFRPKLVFGSWLACVIGMIFAVGAFT